MKTAFVAVAILLSLTSWAAAQDKAAPGPAPVAAQLESNIRKIWEAFKQKDKATVEGLLDERFREVEEGATGFGDKRPRSPWSMSLKSPPTR